jgi:replicative DNA helicase
MLGLSAPDFTIVAARPGVGKTAFLASVVYNIVRRYPQKRIAFFSLEMGSEQVAMRFISMFSGITYNTQRSGKFGFNEYDGYVNAVGELTKNNYNLFINDLPSIKPSKVKQELRKLGAIDLLVFDYLQLAESDEKKEQRHLEVGAVSRALKHLAKELDIPVLTAAQLKRNNNEKPVMSDLAESSYLERDADNIIFLHREFGESNTFVTLAKQRNGATGECILNYNGARTMFEDRVVGNTK